MATDELPETTIEGIAQADAVKLIRALMYGPASEYEQAMAPARDSRCEHGGMAGRAASG